MSYYPTTFYLERRRVRHTSETEIEDEFAHEQQMAEFADIGRR